MICNTCHRAPFVNTFYTYAFLRANRTPYYVGKGCKSRAWNGQKKGCRWPPNDPSRVLILKTGLTEKQAFEHEKYMIAILGRIDLGTGILHNGTDGGEGVSGLVQSIETRRRLAEANRGDKNPMFGKKLSAERRAKIAAIRTGKKYNAETKAKMAASKRGKNNPLAKTFVFTDPAGREFIVTGEFKNFCQRQGLPEKSMRRALLRNCCPPHRSGWLVRYAE